MTCGVDIVEIGRMEKLVCTRGQSLQRLFTEQEITYCRSRGKGQYASFAAIFAAKEAFWKACRTGFRKGAWTDVEVRHDELGAPSFVLHGACAVLLEKRGELSLSLAHDGQYAIAQVVWL